MIEAKRWLAAGLVLLAGCAERCPPEPQERAAAAAPRQTPPPLPPPMRAPVTPLAVPVEPSPVAQPVIQAATPAVSPAPSAGTPVPAPTPPPRHAFAPRNECTALPGFAPFRQALLSAVRNHDAEALARLASPDVRLDFGGAAGPKELRRRLAGTRPELWSALDAIATLGCAADGGVATMPWIFSRMPETVDPYRGLLVLGEGVPLRQASTADAPIRGRLDWALVSLAGAAFDPKARFTEVVASGGTRGHVETARLRRLLDYRLIADRIDGRWRITAFVAGD